jgi:hypothetical protein
MARTVQQIYIQIKAQKDAETSLSGLNSPSNVAIYNLWMWLTAASIALLEQVLDIYQAAIEALIAKAGAGTVPWIRDQILKFQSGDNVEYNNGVVAYTTIDTTKQILTRCSVTQDTNRTINAKVAKSEPPEPLLSGEKTELEYYIKQIQFAGTQINVVSASSDKLYILAEIFYDGQFNSTIQSDVIAALDNYCSTLSSATNFNGTVIGAAIEALILGVPGVKDVDITQIAARADGDAFGSRTIIYDLPTSVNIKQYTTYSGYIIQETDSGHTFTDSLTFTAQ